MAKVMLESVKKVYDGGVEAVKDFNMTIDDKEFIVFVGPSGCGKTTTLRMIAGLEEITKGTIQIDGVTVNDLPPKDRDIAMVFQNYALYPHMTVYENMAFALKLRKTPKDKMDKAIREAAQILELDNLLDRKPKALSGGQRQRVALGRAIVRHPKVFLMDEPLSNLDAKLRVQMRTEILKLHKKLDATVIYVTHDQTEAMTMGTRIVIMKDGDIQQIDTPQQVYDNPVNLFVAGFIGSPQMNILPVEVKNDPSKGGVHLELTDGTKVMIDSNMAKRLEELGHVGRTLKMGIRPECLKEVDKNDTSGDSIETGEPVDSVNGRTTLNCVVDVAELLGSEVYLHCDVAGSIVVARVPAGTFKQMGDRTALAFDNRRIHLFDPETTMAIR